MSPRRPSRGGDPPDGEGVGGEGPVGVSLTGIDGGPCPGVDHHVRTDAGDGRTGRVAVGEVELGPATRHHVVTGVGAVTDEVGSELTGRAGDEDPHQ